MIRKKDYWHLKGRKSMRNCLGVSRCGTLSKSFSTENTHNIPYNLSCEVAMFIGFHNHNLIIVTLMCFKQDGDIDGTPLWPLIYYCLRCGDPRAAIQAVKHVP